MENLAFIREVRDKVYIHIFNTPDILEPLNIYYPLQCGDVLLLGPIVVTYEDRTVSISGERHSWRYFRNDDAPCQEDWLYKSRVGSPNIIDRICDKLFGTSFAEPRIICDGVAIRKESRGRETLTISIDRAILMGHSGKPENLSIEN